MQCKQLETILEQDGLAPLPAAAEEHLAGCPACQSYLADLSFIVEKAHEIPAEVEPPQRIWLSVRAQLQSEGVIKEPAEVSGLVAAGHWWQNFAELFRARNLAAAGMALAAILVLTQLRKQVAVVPANQAQTQSNLAGKESVNRVAPASPVPSPVREQATTRPSQEFSPKSPAPSGTIRAAAISAGTRPASSGALRPSPSEAAFAASSVALNEAEQNLPSMGLEGNVDADASLRQNLRTLNEFIAECEQHLKKHPQDQLAREYLNSAYQQKAELLAALLDSGRSEH
ncbi:MAG: hypothetical protein M3N22_11125 [Acidobacteriota bacterium]|nr:hypothetical protein [Acidobacteriota bacterium]